EEIRDGSSPDVDCRQGTRSHPPMFPARQGQPSVAAPYERGAIHPHAKLPMRSRAIALQTSPMPTQWSFCDPYICQFVGETAAVADPAPSGIPEARLHVASA